MTNAEKIAQMMETNAERIAQMMEAINSIDSEMRHDLVTCRRCRYHLPWDDGDDGRVFCMRLDHGMNKYDFCSYGEEK